MAGWCVLWWQALGQPGGYRAWFIEGTRGGWIWKAKGRGVGDALILSSEFWGGEVEGSWAGECHRRVWVERGGLWGPDALFQEDSSRHMWPCGFSAWLGAAHPKVAIMLIRTIFSLGRKDVSSFSSSFFLLKKKRKQKPKTKTRKYSYPCPSKHCGIFRSGYLKAKAGHNFRWT